MESFALSLKQQFVRHKSRIDLLYRYLTGQGLVQIFNVLNGFFLLRWLSVDEQAKFSIAMGIMATLGILSDLGFGGSLIGLIGNRVHDKVLIGKYIRSIQHYKNRLLIISLTVGVVLVVYYNQQQRWGIDFWLIYGLILISIQAQSMVGYYSAVLQMKKNLNDYYRPLITSSAGRLIITFLLFKLTDLNAVEVVLLITLSLVVNAFWIKRSAQPYYTVALFNDPFVVKDVVKTTKPVMLMVIIYAVQGQLTVLLAGFFGKPQIIAEIGALGRLGQLFAILTPFNAIVLAPYFAKISTDQLLKRFLKVMLIALAVSAPILLTAFLRPGFFLWLLGGKYNSLKDDIGFYVVTSCVWYMSSIIWSINTAKKWNNTGTSILYVVVIVFTQIGCVLFLDISDTFQLIKLSFFLALGTLACYFITSVSGYLQSRKLMISTGRLPVKSGSLT